MMKKVISILTVIVLAVSMMVPFPIDLSFDFVLPASAETVTSGTTGDCTWSLDGTVLTISGNGAMGGYGGNSVLPWGTSITEVIIQDSVTSIGYRAFYNCTGLTSITIPDSVTSIGYSAFSGCTGLTSVTIPDSVTRIGDYAFQGCTGLTSVTIPNSVTSIGEYAFSNCTGLTSITIPNSVTSIGASAFEDCTGLTSVTIGNGVASMGEYAFCGCTGLTGVYITDMAAWCEIDFDNFYANPLYKAGTLYLNGNLVTKLGIPRGVTEIKENAFYGCDNIVSVTIPNSVTSIGNSAFYFCRGLTSITIPDSVTSIGHGAFSVCTGLYSVTIGNGVTSIGASAFEDCTGLTSVTIPDSVTSIGDYAFQGCAGLTSIAIPYTVTSVGTEAFNTHYNDNNVTLMVHEDSAGHTYALTNGNPYELTEHTPAGEDVIVPATCTAEGSISNHCTVCDQDYTKVLPMVEHELEEPVIVPATCTATGSETEHCTSCGQDFVTVLPQLAHVIENNICTLCGCPDIQSEHPYADNLDQIWTHTVEGATSISITFSEETYVEENIDYITLYDGEDNEIGFYTGAELAGQTVTVPGDTVKIRLESDSSGNGYGFSVTAVTAELPEAPEEPEIPTYNGIELTTAGAVQLLRYIDHREGLTAEQADINGDGKVTVFDAVRFLQILNSTPIE